MKKNILLFSTLLFLCCTLQSRAQSDFWNSTSTKPSQLQGKKMINAPGYKTFQLDFQALKAALKNSPENNGNNAGTSIQLPGENGKLTDYEVFQNTTMAKELQNKFPNIRTYDAINKAQEHFAKIDVTLQGFHAIIHRENKSTLYIDPLVQGNKKYYMVYSKKQFQTTKSMDCQVSTNSKNLSPANTIQSFGTCDLRQYDLAVAATAEYTNFHGGTVAQAASAQVTSINRVNSVYEIDMAITLTLIGNNNNIIYTNAGSDPYTNGSPGNMINENQINIDNVIGSGNYDIGHVFGTNSGGLAGLGVVCNNSQKARGVTGSANPVGDPFDIDYVCHEIGHQFGANHTQNNGCNRNNATAVEPGSASTIMGYAGICSPNVQSNSDDHFHGINLEEIGNFITSPGHTCPTTSAIANSAPVINNTVGSTTIPANTPFALTADVTDPDGDPLSYCWEQTDNDVSTQPPDPTSTDGPNFRSISPSSNPTRYFPNINDQINNNPTTWEVIPSVDRTMDFRVTVRDNSAVGGCNDHQDLTITTTSSAGPFLVQYPNATGITWTGSSNETVTWDVANTVNAPVSCSNVDIRISTDGGSTWSTLESSVPNDGSQPVTVPNVSTTDAIIMVICSDGTFFDISDNVFTINMTSCNSPDVPTITANTSICSGASTTLQVNSGNLNDATNWQWYASSCGGTAVSTGTSVNVSPTSTTTYYVRGEGGCVSPGSCADVTVTVNPLPNPTIDPVANQCISSAPVSLSGTPSGGTFSGPGVSGTTFDPGAAGTGTHTITYDYTDGNGCSNSDVTTVQVSGSPSVSAGADQTVCSGDNVTLTASNPDGATITWDNGVTDGVSFTPSATTTYTVTADLSGCISTDQVTVNVNNGYSNMVTATICQGGTYTFPDGATSTSTTTHTSTFTASNGCDSMIITQLNVTPSYNMTENASICQGGAYTFPDGSSATTSTTHTSSLTTAQGCDSVIVTNLTVNPTYNTTENPTICQGNTYTFADGTTATSSTTHTSNLTTANGCDSIIVSNLTVNPSYSMNETAVICQGDSYTFPDGTTSATATTHTSNLSTQNGCDSIIITQLTVNTSYNNNQTITICDGDTYTFADGTTATSSTTHTSNFTSVDGCDSTITTDLTVYPSYSINNSATICQGGTFTFPDGTTASTSTTQTSVFVTAQGCDSTITTQLTVTPSYNMSETVTICSGEVHTFPDGTVDSINTTYTSQLTAAGGCDSTIITTLNVINIDRDLTFSNNTLLADQNGASYQWLDCKDNLAEIQGATGQSFDYSQESSYSFACSISLNGCTDTSDCVDVFYTDVADLSEEGMELYPNPTSGDATLYLGEQKSVPSVKIMDSRGRLIYKEVNIVHDRIQLSLAQEENGIYFVIVTTDKTTQQFKLVKQ